MDEDTKRAIEGIHKAIKEMAKEIKAIKGTTSALMAKVYQ